MQTHGLSCAPFGQARRSLKWEDITAKESTKVKKERSRMTLIQVKINCSSSGKSGKYQTDLY